jgi:hypothetical protein
MRMQSETADNTTWAYFSSKSPAATAGTNQETRSASLVGALSRIEFSEVGTPIPLHAGLQQVLALGGQRKRVLVVCGRSRRLAVEDHGQELREVMGEDGHGHIGHEVRKTIGDVASAFVAARRGAGIVVLQASNG